MKRRGRKSAAQTKAPKKDRIKGSVKNKKGSAKSKTSASKITFTETTNTKIKNLVKKYNSKNTKKVTVPTAKAVVRRSAIKKSYTQDNDLL